MWDDHVAGKIWKAKVTAKHDSKKIQTSVSSQMIRENAVELQCRQSLGFE